MYFDEAEPWFPTDPRPYVTDPDGEPIVDGFDAVNGYHERLADAEAEASTTGPPMADPATTTSTVTPGSETPDATGVAAPLSSRNRHTDASVPPPARLATRNRLPEREIQVNTSTNTG